MSFFSSPFKVELRGAMMAAATALLLVVGAYQPPRTARSRAGCRAAPTLAVTLRPLIDEAPSVDERRPRLSDTVSLREACSDELDGVARLQLDVFLPSTPTPTFVPMLSEMMAGNQRAVRAGMRRQLGRDIAVRVSKGSDILVAAVPADGVARQQHAAVYAEADVRLLGTVDLSSQEVAPPTHPHANQRLGVHAPEPEPEPEPGRAAHPPAERGPLSVAHGGRSTVPSAWRRAQAPRRGGGGGTRARGRRRHLFARGANQRGRPLAVRAVRLCEATRHGAACRLHVCTQRAAPRRAPYILPWLLLRAWHAWPQPNLDPRPLLSRMAPTHSYPNRPLTQVLLYHKQLDPVAAVGPTSNWTRTLD